MNAAVVRAIMAEKDETKALKEFVEDQPPLATHSEAGAMGGRGNKASSDRTGFSRGETASYLARRLKRDHPNIASRIGDEFKSIRAAAKAAGIVRDKTPLEQLKSWWSKASMEEQAQFLRWTAGANT